MPSKTLLAQISALVLVWIASACSAPAPADQAASASTVRVCWPRDPETLNPVTQANAKALQLNNLLYQSLLVVDGVKKVYVPWLADSLPSVRRTATNSYFTYRIRSAATWDNGQPILARDVVFSLKALTCPGLPNERVRSIIDFIRDVQSNPEDARQFTLVCQGYASDYHFLTGDFPILPEYLLDSAKLLQNIPLKRFTGGDSTLAQDAAVQEFAKRYNEPQQWRSPQRLRGSGPYQLASWQTNQRIVLTRKPRWWGDRLNAAPPQLVARPQQLEFHIIPDPATAFLALQRGDVDVYPNMPAADFQRLRTSSAATALQLFSPASYRVAVLDINTQKPLLRDARTRQALAHLLNTQALLGAVQYGQGQLSTGLINPREKWAYYDSLPLRRYDERAAATLLRAAGWQQQPNGWYRSSAQGKPEQLQLQVHYLASNRALETAALQLKQAAAHLGIPITLQASEMSQLSALRQAGNYDLTLRTLYGNPFSYDLRPLYHTSNIGSIGGNITRFGNASSDRLLEAVVSTPDSARKAHLLRRLQLLLYQEAPTLVLYVEPNLLVVNRRFQGIRPSGLEPGYDLPAFSPAGIAAK